MTPTSSVAAPQLKSICVEEIALDVKAPGALGGVVSGVVAALILENAPALSAASTACGNASSLSSMYSSIACPI